MTASSTLTARTPGRAVALSLALLLALTFVVTSPPRAAAYAYAAPAGLAGVSTSRNAIAVGWKPMSGVTKYRVQYSTSSSMSNPVYKRFTAPYGELTNLTSAKTYYIKVRAITDDGQNLSPYSSAVSVATRSSNSYPWLAPTGVSASGTAESGFTATWDARATGLSYRIRWAKKGSTAYAYKRVTTTSYAISGLASGTAYQYSVRVIDAAGNSLSEYSPSMYVTTASAASTTYVAPTGLVRVSTARDAIAVAWAAHDVQPPAYQVQASKSSSFSSPLTVPASDPYAEITGLSSSTTYYVRVRAASTTGQAASPWSSAISVTTASSSGYQYLAPAGLSGKTSGTTTATVTWTARGTAPQYRVRWTKKGSTTYSYASVAATSYTISGLTPATTYTVRVRAITTDGASLSAYSPDSTITTATASNPLRVASFNIRNYTSYDSSGRLPNELSWYDRRSTVVAQAKGQDPDVIGFQEASQGWIKDPATGERINKSQFEDLVERLGTPYTLTDPDRNNCLKSTTPTDCVYKDQGASKGTKIIYNASRLTLNASGSKLAGTDPNGYERYMAWAIFTQKSTGKQFFFADAHLTPGDDSDGTYTIYNARIAQMKTALAEITAKNPARLPVIFVGDWNSTKWDVPANAPYDRAVSYGLVDPLGNTYRSTTTAPGATVERRILTNVGSYSGFQIAAPWKDYINGSYLDYIMTTPMRVSEWQTVANLDANHNNVGVIASDHYMVRATVYLP